MPRVLIVHHSPSPTTRRLFEAVRDGAGTDELEGIEVAARTALAATAADVLAADAILIGTTANLGYMSGALKHFFDTVYYPCLDETAGLAWGAWIHGNNDTTGAERALESITTGLGWKRVAEVVTVLGDADADADRACFELGATVAARLVL